MASQVKSPCKKKKPYQRTEADQILLIEQRADGTILGSCPAAEPLRDAGSYECKPDNNLWVQENSPKLILYEAGR